MKACNLITPAELSAVLGGIVGHSTGIFSPKNPQRGLNGDFWSCEVTVGMHKIRIFCDTLRVTEEGKKHAQEQEDRFRKEGYQIQKKELNGLHCATTVPPRGVKDLPPPRPSAETECSREKGPYHVMVTVEGTGANDMFPMGKVALLVDKASWRLPAQ